MNEPNPNDMEDPSNWAVYSPESTDGKRTMNTLLWVILTIFLMLTLGGALYFWFMWKMTFRG